MLNIYVDESCQNAHRFMALGGMCISREDIVDIHDEFLSIREEYHLFGEIRWTKISNAKYDAYQAFVDKFFELSQKDLIHFHSVIIDNSQIDDYKYNVGDREIGFSKFIYQLLIKFGRFYGHDQTIHCYLDYRSTQQSLDELRDILNNGIAKHWGIHSRPFRTVQFRDSKKSDFLQINDILLGAVATRRNGHHLLPNCNSAKQRLGERIMQKAGINSLEDGTPIQEKRFTVWNFQLK